MTMDRHREIERLRRERPRNLFLRGSTWALAGLGAYAWWVGDFAVEGWLGERRWRNLHRFLGELRPYPLRDRDFDLAVAWEWAAGLWGDRGAEAVTATLAISVAAIVFAALGALLFTLPATRTISTAEPYLPAARTPGRLLRLGWWGVVYGTRAFLIFLRAIPELVWAYLLIALLGPGAWPAVLALGLHNLGILGKLDAEVVENLDPAVPQALRGLGASRTQIALVGVFPAALNRFLLFFFYRWESCVREATVLGLLGIVSLGYWIQDARARNHYDTMIFLVLLGSALVLVGDLVSTLVRRRIREAGAHGQA